ncbi:hypothetical protein LDENG_00066190 [Lucifuga dentata]|nr:hypothetical protein LDENG_00066190 [Lucifuga dentata]
MGHNLFYVSLFLLNTLYHGHAQDVRPMPTINSDKSGIPAGGTVTITCSVQGSSGWEYTWYKDNKIYAPLNMKNDVFHFYGQIHVSEEGWYYCKGGRGNPVYYTRSSDIISIKKNVANQPVVTLQASWPVIYSGDVISLSCEIKDEGDTEWEYTWDPPRSPQPQTSKDFRITAFTSDSGKYKCWGRDKNRQWRSTSWSAEFRLTVSDLPMPVLTVSPSWLSPGVSVSLSCKVEDPAAGWRFYWYKAVPKISNNYYSYELLPGNINGTEEDSYVVHEPTHTAGFTCRVRRQYSEFYSLYSRPAFVWSGDVHSAASATVSPSRVQHFSSESVSLSCEGNSTEWTVKWFTENHILMDCSFVGEMTGSTCRINRIIHSNAVCWCESGSGQFSNAINITVQNKNVILESPAHPVTEGDPVLLVCKTRTKTTECFPFNVAFYKNNKLIQNDTSEEMIIPAVSKSDESFYKCIYKCTSTGARNESPQSWMAVKSSPRPESSSLMALIAGLTTGIVFLILLLLVLLYCYRKSKDPCCDRHFRQTEAQSTNQGSAADHVGNDNLSEENGYVSFLHDGLADKSSDVTYSLIQLKNAGKKGTTEPVESCVYSNVKTVSATGLPTPTETGETVYSEVKQTTALGL